MRVLTFTSLFPSAARPRHGSFVEARVAAMERVAGVDVRVVAPVPWFPFAASRFGEYGRYAKTPRSERRDGREVLHPRYPMMPGPGMYAQPLAMAAAALSTLRALQRRGFVFDVVDAHYFYPDGVAAALLARQMDKALVITARGSDVNLLGELAWPRRAIRWAARHAHALVTVSADLAQRLTALGVEPSKISVVRNGVDTERFAPVDPQAARERFALPPGPLIASVGNLVPEKGHDLVIDALADLPRARLLIVGDGPLAARLRERIRDRGLDSRVRMLPAQPQHELKWIYAAVDAIVLASSREGLPNVLLESLACGTRVVATRVGGIPEVVTSRVAGRLADERSAAALACAIADVLASAPTPAATRQFAARFDWSATARGHVAALERAISIRSAQRYRSVAASRP